ncbi:unnamed protein product [Mytilus coruscus]|uniref:HTH psq-type domain-containing protein n=1 Tax=Mytilus coruscus TaxID=42192 RepID=A0A6J8DFQ4_MYTCO|nr:unnamed protein product [Mytilus coruscus]
MNYEEKMIIAYEAVVSKRMSFKEACTKFKIPDSTLRDRVKRGNHMKGRRGQNATLDQNQSEKLTKCLMMLLKQGYYTIDELCTLSSQYAKPGSIYSLSSTELSYSWAYVIREVPSDEEAITLFICANEADKVIPPWYVFPEAKSKVDIKRLQEDCKPGFGFPAEEKLFPSEISF